MKAIITKTKNGQFRFNLTGGNGEKIATGETYTHKAKVLKTLNKYFPLFPVEDRTQKK